MTGSYVYILLLVQDTLCCGRCTEIKVSSSFLSFPFLLFLSVPSLLFPFLFLPFKSPLLHCLPFSIRPCFPRPPPPPPPPPLSVPLQPRLLTHPTSRVHFVTCPQIYEITPVSHIVHTYLKYFEHSFSDSSL